MAMKQINQLRSGGATEDQIREWMAPRVEQLRKGGATEKQIRNHFGIPMPDMSEVKDFAQKNINQYSESLKSDEGQSKEFSFMDAVEAGFQASSGGLILRGKLPEKEIPESDDTFGTKAGAAVGGLLGDLGPGLLGYLSWGANPATGMAGAFAVPALLRKTLTEQYQNGSVTSAKEFAERATAIVWESTKGAATGLATFFAGKAGGSLASKMLGPGAASSAVGKGIVGASTVAAEIPTMTTTAALLEGHLPEPSDFAINAILLAGPKSVGYVSPKLMSIWRKTGVRPKEVAEAAAKEPALKEQILSIERPDQQSKIGEYKKIEVSESIGDQITKAEESIFIPKRNTIITNLIKKAAKTEKPKTEIESFAETVLLHDRSIPRTMNQLKVLSRVGEQIELVDPLIPTGNINKLKYQYESFVNDLHPIHVLTRKASEGVELRGSQDPSIMAHLYRKWPGIAFRGLKWETVDFHDTTKVTGEGFLKIIEDVPRSDKDALQAHIMAKRDVELSKRKIKVKGKEKEGIETGIDIEASKATIKELKEFDSVSRRLTDFSNRGFKYGFDAGLMTPEFFKAAQKNNLFYVPFQRIMEVDLFGQETSGSKTFKPIKGSTKKIKSPIDQMPLNYIAIVQAAERNRVYKSLVDNAKLNPEILGQHMVEVKGKVKPIKITSKEIREMFKKSGIDPDSKLAIDTYTIFRPERRITESNEITYLDKGKLRTFKLSPELAKAMDALDNNVSTSSILTLPRFFTSMLRFGVTSTPEFSLSNYIKDQQVAMINSKYKYVPFVNVFTSLKAIFKNEKIWKDAMSSKAVSGVYGDTLKLLDSRMWEFNKDVGVVGRVRNGVYNTGQAFNVMMMAFENATRLPEFKKGIKAGDIEKGAYNAGEISLNFNKGSYWTRTVNKAITFFNVSVLSIDKFAESFNKQNFKKTMTMGSAITAYTIYNYWQTHTDENGNYRKNEIVDKTPVWEKNLFWIVPVDNWVPAINVADYNRRPEQLRKEINGKLYINDPYVFRIPKAHAHGIIFGTLVERLLDAIFEEDPSKFKDMDSLLQQGFSVGAVPPMIAPVAEQFANKNLFTGRPIIPRSLEENSPEYQYTEYTSPLGKFLGKIIAHVPWLSDVGPEGRKLSSPMVIDNYVRAWGGTLGRYASDMISEILDTTGIERYNENAMSKDLKDMPIIRAFVSRNPSMQAEVVQEFYELYGDFRTVRRDIKKLQKEGDTLKAAEIQKKHSRLLMSGLEQRRKIISEHFNYINTINKAPKSKISPDEKRQLIEGMYWAIIKIAEDSVNLNKRINKEKD